jgi:TctA family transporter
MQNAITELEQLTVTSSAKRFLSETAKWCKLLSIVGFIGIGLILIIALFTGTMVGLLQSTVQKPLPEGLSIATSITYIMVAIIYFFPLYYLFQFSKKMKKALLTKNDETLEKAFEMLKSHYKYIGVLTI